MSRMAEQQLYINGGYTSATSGRTFETINPATGEVLATVQAAGREDVDRAVESAQRGQKIWAAMTAMERSRILRRAVDLLRQRNDELARLETLDTGKPLSETAAVDIVTGADVLEYYAGLIPALEGSQIPLRDSSFVYTRREPLGVVAGIGAWNYPIQIALWKSAPALAAGNAMIFKPSEVTPLTALKLAEIYSEAGLPDGVFNVLPGIGAETGQYLTEHPDIAKISFTGGVASGKKVMANSAASSLKEVTMELGGKSPNIFFADVMDEEDAFFDKALEGFALFAFNQGEVCTCPSRALVQESIYERFMERAIRRVESIRSGNPLDSVTQMGAQVSHGQLETILNYIDIGKKEGADVLTGGRRKLLEGELKDGYYLEPTILFGQNNMRVFQEEIFGPVLAVTTFKPMEEALELANDTQYGLGAGVWSRNGNLAYKMGRGIQAGRVWTNCYHAYPAHAAFGGYKQSGIGRETHKMMLEHYQQTKCLLVSYSDKPLGLF